MRSPAVYMAPEVFQREYGTAADMWSLGMMLFQFMTCRFPFWCAPPRHACSPCQLCVS
jgi:serine/threonine protein kinase